MCLKFKISVLFFMMIVLCSFVIAKTPDYKWDFENGNTTATGWGVGNSVSSWNSTEWAYNGTRSVKGLNGGDSQLFLTLNTTWNISGYSLSYWVNVSSSGLFYFTPLDAGMTNYGGGWKVLANNSLAYYSGTTQVITSVILPSTNSTYRYYMDLAVWKDGTKWSGHFNSSNGTNIYTVTNASWDVSLDDRFYVRDLTAGKQYYIDLVKFYNCSIFNAGCEPESDVPFSSTSNMSITFVNQTPSDITNTNIFAQNNISITFNVTNTTSIKNMSLYYTVNSSDTCFIFVNETCNASGYQYANYSYSQYPNYTWNLLDNDFIPGTYLIDEDLMESTPHSTFQLSTSNTFALQTIFNVSAGKQYNIFEDMVLNQSGVGALRHYYCNSSYDLGSVVDTNTNCILFYSLASMSSYNHSHSLYSKHQIIPFTVNSSGYVSGVKVTSTSYFLVRGIASTTWNVSYIPNVSRAGGSRTSSNGGTTWSNLSGTFDMHIHQFNNSEQLCYYSEGYLSDGTKGNTSIRCDSFDITRFPPLSPIITSPLDGSTVTSNVSINYTNCTTPYGVIDYYTINITEGSSVLLSRNNSLNNSYLWIVDHTDNGDLDVRVDCFTNYSMSSFSVNRFTLDYPLPFPYNGTAPSDWVVDFDVTTGAGVALLFFWLACATICLIIGFILRIPILIWLAAAMFFFLGFILAIKASILLGILVCVMGVFLFIAGALMV